jgi:hypothetical protein
MTYDGLISAEEEWAEYCRHGYYHGKDCPNCDVPSYWPEIEMNVKCGLPNNDPGDETAA